MAETRLFSLHPFRHGPGILAEGGEYFDPEHALKLTHRDYLIAAIAKRAENRRSV